jgi:hypothetical protein
MDGRIIPRHYRRTCAAQASRVTLRSFAGTSAIETPAILTGNYTRPDDLASYEYEVLVHATLDRRLAWTATVTSLGAFRGRLSGVLKAIAGMNDAEIELAMRDVIESAIRDRVGVT